MLHIILTILKVIGIILLVVLGILLAALLLMLFVPLRYRVHLKKGSGPLAGDGKVTWLLHLLRADLVYEKMHCRVDFRVFGFRVKTVSFPKDEKKPEKSSDADSASEKPEQAKPAAMEGRPADTVSTEDGSAKTASTDVDSAANIEITAKAAPDSEENHESDASDASDASAGDDDAHQRPGLLQRIVSLVLEQIQGIPALPAELYDRIDEILLRFESKLDKLHRKIDPFLTLEAENMIRKSIRYLKYVMRGYAPRKITGYIHFGTGAPDLTGKLCGLIYVLMPLAADSYEVDPDFYNAVLETDTYVEGRIRMYRLGWVGLQLLVDKEFWRFLRIVRGRDPEGKRRGSKRAGHRVPA